MKDIFSSIKVGDKFYVSSNDYFTIDGGNESYKFFTISQIGGNYVTIGGINAEFGITLVRRWFNEGVWVCVRLERKKKLEKMYEVGDARL